MKYLKQKETIFIIIFAFLMLIFDQVSKIFASNILPFRQGVTIINQFLYFTYTTNEGAAWSILSGNRWLFVGVAIVATIVLGKFFIHSKLEDRLTRFGIILIISGTIGNAIDRVVYGYVRDFIDVLIFGYDFPIFNIADILICIGVFLVLIEIFEEEMKQWKHSRLS